MIFNALKPQAGLRVSHRFSKGRKLEVLRSFGSSGLGLGLGGGIADDLTGFKANGCNKL
jgi:hypothetical protein